MDPWELNKHLIVWVSVLGALAEFYQAYLIRKAPYAWVKWGLGAILLFWAGYYLRSILNIDLGAVHQIYVRTGILLTNALIAAGAILSAKRMPPPPFVVRIIKRLRRLFVWMPPLFAKISILFKRKGDHAEH